MHQTFFIAIKLILIFIVKSIFYSLDVLIFKCFQGIAQLIIFHQLHFWTQYIYHQSCPQSFLVCKIWVFLFQNVLIFFSLTLLADFFTDLGLWLINQSVFYNFTCFKLICLNWGEHRFIRFWGRSFSGFWGDLGASVDVGVNRFVCFAVLS